ncbi:hypothetical protein NVP1015O_04 [Vibrio phage 1.015.O._10N.222.51.E5]|nr:hypothetical protein NVP1015O_04 [Vibrio phage 1.015.O._10N.222.51.E5]
MAIQTKNHLVTEVGVSPLVKLAAIDNPRLSGMVIIKSGTPTYSLEYSLDGRNFLPLSNDLNSTTLSNDFTIVFPIHSIRLNVTAGIGEAELIVRYDDGGF